MKISNSIEKARLAQGYSQDHVARLIGVSRPSYNNIENGTKELTISQAKTLASVLGISIDDILGMADGLPVFTDIIASTDKYKQMILNCICFGSSSDGKITKTKLAKLVYLADFIWYYLNFSPMSGKVYRKLPQGPVADVFFRALDEMEEDGAVIRETKGNAFMYSMVEGVAPVSMLSSDEISLIKKISEAWQKKSTEDIVKFTHEQLPWQICREGEVIPYGLITQEEPERVYGTIQL